MARLISQAVNFSIELPDYVTVLFWDYDVSALVWERHRDLIIQRVLASGTWEAVTWLRGRLGDDALRSWLLQHEGRGLSRRQLRFWQLILELPAPQVDAWLAEPARQIWEGRVQP